MKRSVLMIALGLLVLGVSPCVVGAVPLDDAYRLMAHGEFEQAVEALEKVLAEAPEQAGELRAETTFLLGRAHESLGELDAALDMYRVVTEEFTTSSVFANASLSLAKLHVRRGRPKEAVTALETAIAAGPSPEHKFRAQLFLAEVISAPGSGIEDQDHALVLFHDLDDKARKPLDVARLNYGLGFCYQRKGNWQKAEQHYITVTKTAPRSLWAAYSCMQRISYYRRMRLRDDAVRLEKQLNEQLTAPVDAAHQEPRAPKWARRQKEEAEAQPAQDGEIELPRNAVFSHNGYNIAAERFVLNSSDRVLVGHGDVSLVNDTKTARTEIHAISVRIDLRSRDALFAGKVSFKTETKTPGAKPHKIPNLQELVIDLDTGLLRFRLSEPPH